MEDTTITHPEKESPEEEDEDRDTHSDRETAGHETVTDFTISSEGRDEGKGSIVSSETPTDRDECVLRLQFLLQIPSLGPKPEFAILVFDRRSQNSLLRP